MTGNCHAFHRPINLHMTDPLLYDRCIRRFQTAAEREADGKSKGYSGVLEADLYRSEAKIAALQSNNAQQHEDGVQQLSTSTASTQAPNSQSDIPYVSYSRGSNGEVLPEEEDEVPSSKDEGMDRWKYGMTLRFLKGEDPDFDYKEVDESEEWDAIEGREEEERWFDEEEPEWVDEEAQDEGKQKGTGGETGVQDF